MSGAVNKAYSALLDEAGVRVKAAVLDHDIPCLGYALEEERHHPQVQQ